jgi:hypothetical protein
MIALRSSSLHGRTSTHAGGNGNCVEVATAPAAVAVRDSKDRSGPVLAFAPAVWTRFLTSTRSGHFDRF